MDPRDDPYFSNGPWNGASRSSNSELIIILPLAIIASIIAIILLIPVLVHRYCRKGCHGTGCDVYSDYCVRMMGNWKPNEAFRVGVNNELQERDGDYAIDHTGKYDRQVAPNYTVDNQQLYYDDGTRLQPQQQETAFYYPDTQQTAVQPPLNAAYRNPNAAQVQYQTTQPPTMEQQQQWQNQEQQHHQGHHQQQSADNNQAHIKWKHVQTGVAVLQPTQPNPTMSVQKTSEGYIQTHVPVSLRQPQQHYSQ